MSLTPISQAMQEPLGARLREHYLKVLKWDWIFSTPLEKIIITASLLWSIYSIGKLIWGIF